MLKILHKGNQVSLDLDTSGFTGDPEHDKEIAYVKGLIAGRLVALDGNAKAQLADGLASSKLRFIGFVINDAAGYFFENIPALASKMVACTLGNGVFITDQIDTAEEFHPGDPLYVGTGAKIGLITKTPPTGADLVGIAGSHASSAAPELKIFAF